MKTELFPISKLTLLERNPRTITKEQMQKLCKSIQDDPDFLNARPILVNKTIDIQDLKSKEIFTVYAGNQRVRAAKKLKIKEIPCIIEEELCPEIMKKRTILDNSSYGNWDWDELGNSYDIEMLIDCGINIESILGDLSNISDSENSDKEEEKKVCDKCGKKIKK